MAFCCVDRLFTLMNRVKVGGSGRKLGGWDPGPSSWERSPLSLRWLMATGRKALLAFLESFLLASADGALVNQVARAGLAIEGKPLVCVKYTQQI